MLELAESHLSLFIYLFQTVFLDELLAAEKKKKKTNMVAGRNTENFSTPKKLSAMTVRTC